MTDHETCCCAETIDDIRALEGFYEAALHDRDELASRLNQALTNYRALQAAYGAASRDRDELVGLLLETTAERDRARTTAARLEAELARGFRTAAPDVTLTRTHNGAPGTPDEAVPGPSGALGRPGSENAPTDAHRPQSGPESPETPVTARTTPATPDHSDERALCHTRERNTR